MKFIQCVVSWSIMDDMLLQKCSECGESPIGPWQCTCPFCGINRRPLFSIDDDGFLCELDGNKIVDGKHWILEFCNKWEWQAFCVSRDGSGNICGLRRTCEEWDDNSNKGWCFARRTVSRRNAASFSKKPKLAHNCVKILKSSIFHVWPSVPQRYPGQCETDYYVNLGMKNGDEISHGSFVIERDTFEFVKEALRLGRPTENDLRRFLDELKIPEHECLGKERPDDYDISGELVDRWSISLILLRAEQKSRLDEIFQSMKTDEEIVNDVDPGFRSWRPAFVPGFLNGKK